MRLGVFRHQIGEIIIGRAFARQFIELVLGEIADREPRRVLHFSARRVELSAQEFREGRLAVAVRSEERDAIVRIKPQRDVAQDRLAFDIADRRIVPAHQRRSERLRRIGEMERGDAILDHIGNRFELGQSLDAALCLARLRGLVAEALDEGLHMLALVFLLLLEL